MSADSVTIVSGLPRSGTSLLMQMLQAGGLQLLSDGQRAPDRHNPRGYFELESVKHSRHDVSWVDQAGHKAVKVIHLLLPYLPANRTYRVIFMRRDLQEVIESQRVMLQQQGRPVAALSDAALASVFQKQLDAVCQWLSARPAFQVLFMNYKDLLDRPAEMAGRINCFLNGNLLVADMAAAVDLTLYRQRKPAN
ncbi:MAG: sulfotransferase domain-containing protein [Limisphaerales bacterium]